MKKSIGYAVTAVLVVMMLGTLVLGTLRTAYDPIGKNNLPVEKITLDDFRAWINSPSFKKWTNMDLLDEYLRETYDLTQEQVQAQADRLSKRQLLSLTGRSASHKRFTTGQFMTSEGQAITEIDCDLEDQELRFELTNVGETNWFLIDQSLTNVERGSAGYKELNGPLAEATPIKLYVNNFLVNSLGDKYWMGEKLFYPEGKTFADAARADFLRMGKTTGVKLEPIPPRTGLLKNDYLLIATGFTEKGRFACE